MGLLSSINYFFNYFNAEIDFERETHQCDCPRVVSRDVASVFQTHYFIICLTYQRDDVCDRQRHLFQNCCISVAPAFAPRAAHRASHVALDVASFVALVCEQSRDCRVPRRVPNRARARVGMFCTIDVIRF